MTDEDVDHVRDALQHAIADVLAPVDDLLIKWTAVVEVVGTTGRRACWTLSTPGALPWDLLGLMEYALAIERAAIARDDDE